MQELINKKFQEITESGKLDEIVTNRVVDFVNSTIKESLYSYGDVAKTFKKELDEKIIEGFTHINFLQYSTILKNLIEAELSKSIIEFAVEPTKKMIKSFTGTLEKQEWKLSEIIQKFIEEEVIPDDRNESGEIHFTFERSDYGTCHAYFNEDRQKHSWDCDYRLMIDKDGKMYTPRIKSRDMHPYRDANYHGFEMFLFKLYAMQCTII